MPQFFKKPKAVKKSTTVTTEKIDTRPCKQCGRSAPAVTFSKRNRVCNQCRSQNMKLKRKNSSVKTLMDTYDIRLDVAMLVAENIGRISPTSKYIGSIVGVIKLIQNDDETVESVLQYTDWGTLDIVTNKAVYMLLTDKMYLRVYEAYEGMEWGKDLYLIFYEGKIYEHAHNHINVISSNTVAQVRSISYEDFCSSKASQSVCVVQ